MLHALIIFIEHLNIQVRILQHIPKLYSKMYSEILFLTYISTGSTIIVSKHGKQTSKQLAVAVAASKYNGIAEIIKAESSSGMSNQFMMDYIKIKKLEKSLSRHQRNTSWLQRVVTNHANTKNTKKHSKLILDYVNTVTEAKKSLQGWSSKSGEKSAAGKKWKKYISDRMKQKKLNVMLYKFNLATKSTNKDHLSSHHVHQ